jgi:hypothetical protein
MKCCRLPDCTVDVGATMGASLPLVKVPFLHSMELSYTNLVGASSTTSTSRTQKIKLR